MIFSVMAAAPPVTPLASPMPVPTSSTGSAAPAAPHHLGDPRPPAHCVDVICDLPEVPDGRLADLRPVAELGLELKQLLHDLPLAQRLASSLFGIVVALTFTLALGLFIVILR